MNKLIRITTVPISLDKLLSGQLSFMNQFYHVIGISSDKTYLQKISQKENIEVIHVEMTRKITPLKDLKSTWELYKFFKKEKPLIVHTHTPKAGTAGMIAAKFAGVPIRLHTVAGLPLLEASGSKRKLLNFVEKVTYACATKIYPNSLGLKKIIIQQQFCNPNKLKVLANGSSNGIDTSHFDSNLFSANEVSSLKQKLGISENDFVFVFVGRLVGDKGINELVSAFSKLNSKETKLVLVGSFENELDPLQPETLAQMENNKSIIYLGYQTDVRPYFAISNCLVFPSYREGFPNVVMQAGAMGLPSIVSNINGCNEIIIQDYNGIIIPVKNSNILESTMRKMLEDTPYYQFLKLNARKRILENYEQKVVWNALLQEYKNLENNV